MKTVCITQADDGTFSVYEEMPEANEMESVGKEADEGAQGEAFDSLDSALAAAAALFDGAPADQEPMMEGEAEFRAGFDSARGGQEF